jgi:SAM-dependent methyltransferase
MTTTPVPPADPATAGTAAILDVRAPAEFESLHRTGAVNIPLEELADRVHELPPRDRPLIVFHNREPLARWARSRLRARHRHRVDIVHGDEWLRTGPTARGHSQGRLWQPHALLEEAARLSHGLRPALPGVRALDIACGCGRDAVYLALQGWEVEAWDRLPDALNRANDLARRSGVRLMTRRKDVEREPSIAAQTFDLICCFNFLHRPLMPVIARAIRPGGLVVYETFVHPQRELFGKPTGDAHLLKPGELAACFTGWNVLISREGLGGPRRFAASLVARKPLGTSLNTTPEGTRS